MVRHGRPTPQAVGNRERPRYRDLDPAEVLGLDVNPYLTSHKTWSPELVPAGEAPEWRDRWPDAFGRAAPLVLEVGAGNGEFAAALATRDADANHIAVELRYKRAVLCARRVRQAGLRNLRIVRYHAAFLDDFLPPESVDRFWVNHPDPWPKRAHEKHRLIAPWFLTDLAALAKDGAIFHLKTDSPTHLAALPAALGDAWELVDTRTDISAQGAPWPNDLPTKFQTTMGKLGRPVLAALLRRRPRR